MVNPQLQNHKYLKARFGGRLISTQCGELVTLQLKPKERAQIHLDNARRTGINPHDEDLERLIPPDITANSLVEAQTSERIPSQRLTSLNAPRGANADIIDGFTWYGGMALFALLSKRGEAKIEDIPDILELSRLIDYRPFCRIDECVARVFWHPNQVSNRDIDIIDQTIEATEEWIKLVLSNRFFSLLMQNPPKEEEFALELRALGAPTDFELYNIVGGAHKIEPETLIPGAHTFINLKETSEFIYDTEIVEGGKRVCSGLRDFRKSLGACIAKQDTELNRIFGAIAVKAFNEFASPLLDTNNYERESAQAVTGQLLFLRDSLLRLINRRFGEFNQATEYIEEESGIGKLLPLISTTTEARVDFLRTRATEVALLSTDPKQVALVKSILEATPEHRRSELFDLYLTAPALLEAHGFLNEVGKRTEECLGCIPTLVTPLGTDHKKRSIAQLISELGKNKRRSSINILFDNKDWLLTGTKNPQLTTLLSDMLTGLELIEKPSKFFTSCKNAIDAGQIEEASRIINETLGPSRLPVTTPPISEKTPAAPIDTTVVLTLPEWCRWVATLLPEGETHLIVLKDHISRYGREHWYKKMIFDTQQRSTYISLLTDSDPEKLNTFILQRAREGSPKLVEPEVAKERFNYKRILICGGSGGAEREKAFRKSFPSGVELDFYYDKKGGNSVKHIRSGSISPETLVIWICDQTSHSECWRVWDIAIAANAGFEPIPKAVQNPDRIAEIIEQRPGARKR